MKFTIPQIQLLLWDAGDILTASGENDSSVPSTAPAVTTVAPTVADVGLDNELSAKKWKF